MTTVAELQQQFFPHTIRQEPTHSMAIWSDACTSSPRILATAPSIDSRCATDDNGNFNEAVTCSCKDPLRSYSQCGGLTLTVPLSPTHEPGTLLHGTNDTMNSPTLTNSCVVHVDEQRCLARFLSSGDKNDLNISVTNCHYYLQFANMLNHKQLENLCEAFFQNNEKVWDSGSCLINTSLTGQDKDNSQHVNNNTNEHCTSVNEASVPKFHIMFLKQGNTDEHNRVLVVDVRRLHEVHKILDVKKVTRFGDGFASCAAYIRQCPYVFISGGHGKKEHSLIKYDVVENKWFQSAHLKYARAKHAMACASNCIYVIGGKRCSIVEKYDLINSHCSEVSALPVGVHSCAVTVFKNKIFIFGGKNIRGCVSTVQCIDTKTDAITNAANLPFECSGGQAIVVKDKIYFATHHGHMIKFDPVTCVSELCAQQPYRRKGFVMFEKNGSLHLFGGIRTDGCIENESTMFTYCPVSNNWQKTLSFGVPLPVQTSCTVVYPKECPVKPFVKLFGYC